MVEQESIEFRRMLVASATIHAVLVGVVFFLSIHSPSRMFEIQPAPGPMNVIWAKTVRSPGATPEHKLPGPIIKPEVIVKPSAEKPKMVMPEDAKKSKKEAKEKAVDATETADPDALRRKAMADAIAALPSDSDEHRPMPKADNYPSFDPAAERGVPAGPFGGVGVLGGNPAFTSYRGQIKQILTDNFLWIQKETNLRSEVSFRVNPEGGILQPVLTKSSGNYAFDQAAIRAVKKSSPLPRPPDEFVRQLVEEEFVIVFEPQSK